MKKLLPAVSPIILIAIGLSMAVLSAGVSPIPASSAQINLLGVGKSLQITATPTPTGGISEIGSTDGIVMMGIIIVLIVLLPVLVRRKSIKQ